MPEPRASTVRPGRPALLGAWLIGLAVIADIGVNQRLPVAGIMTALVLVLILATVAHVRARQGARQRDAQPPSSPPESTLRAEIDARRELDARHQHDLDALYLRLACQQDAIAVIAHEMRTPLATIEMARDALEPLAQAAGESETRRLHRIRRAVRRITRLSENLQSTHRLEHMAERMAFVPLALAPFLEKALISADMMDEVQLTVVDTPIVDGDSGLLDILFTNIVGNAIKYGAGGPVCMTLTQVQVHAEVCIQDDGPGMPEHELPRIFDRFYRGTQAAAQSGAGLGLYVAKRIAEAHGGELRAVNRAGGGLAVTLRLPLQAQ